MILIKNSLYGGAVALAVLGLTACGGGSSDSGGSQSGGSSSGETSSSSSVANSNSNFPAKILSSHIADIDADGDGDVIVSPYSSESTSEIQLFLNSGGTFDLLSGAFPEFPATFTSAAHIRTLDANNDGNKDVLALLINDSYESSVLNVYLGQGDGTFTTGATITSSPLSGWGEFRVADFDGDGNTDFVLTQNPMGQCSGNPAEDICWGGHIYLNDGSGNFLAKEISLTDSLLNSTTSVDKLQAIDAHSGAVFIPDQPDLNVWSLLADDVNGDGTVDLVAPTFGDRMTPTFINNSLPGSLQFSVVYSNTLTNQADGALVDVNRDALPDLVSSSAIFNGSEDGDPETMTVPVYVSINTGDGIFAQATTDYFAAEVPSVQHARSWSVADFNQDGFDDLFVADHGYDFPPFSGYPNLLLMNTDAGLENTTSSALESQNSFSHGASVGDINGDGYPDLLINNDIQIESTHADAAPAVSRLWLNNGDGTFTEGSL
ncbi:FG-GAP repeat domain-containing protein [Gilvimarinus chinensis]|uniref:FG-GAP repeat domain-containing protein n=1 Tax=Gilvimarinus chinensis TaxID=396005 RepID=UPI000373CA83|nr:VCBS repeat-containing protein [Gilvimarinus chinensis]